MITMAGNLDPTKVSKTGDTMTGDLFFAAGKNANAFGQQTDVTASRTIGTNYRNTSSHAMLVVVSGNKAVAVSAIVSSDAAAAPTVVVAQGAFNPLVSTIPFVVLPLNYYRVDGAGATIAAWIEWT